MYKFLLLAAVSLCQFHVSAKSHEHKSDQLPHVNYVNLPVQLSAENTLNVGAQLRIPRDVNAPIPAVIILHNSAGIDSTGSFYAKNLTMWVTPHWK
ncbi:MAG: hypothetical protein HWE10_11240 [Gammaproteobacteria bacterium]|nr:hypothetical protein [Gammaproteobacteria bacterium]